MIDYPSLARVRRLEELLDNPQHAAAILFVTNRMPGGGQMGHWLALFQRSDGTVVFFDPYGKMPDTHRAWLSPSARTDLGEVSPLLMPLIEDFGRRGGEVVASPEKVQADKPSISTCGRHVAYRIIHRDLSDDEYWREVSAIPGISRDRYVTLVTEGLLAALGAGHA